MGGDLQKAESMGDAAIAAREAHYIVYLKPKSSPSWATRKVR